MLLVCAYAVLVQAGSIPGGDGISQLQANMVRMQRALYSSERHSAVLVGSSLAANVKVERLDSDFMNLGINGGSSQTGLELLLSAHRSPKIVMIEISESCKRGLDKDALANLASPRANQISTLMPFTLQEYQPANVLLSRLKGKRTQESDDTVSEDVRLNAVKRWASEHEQPYDAALVDVFKREFALIRSQIERLGNKGVECLLVYIPQDDEVDSKPAMMQFKDLIMKEFPMKTYHWLVEPGLDVPWRTNDGIHLVPSQSRIFAEQLVQAKQQLADETS